MILQLALPVVMAKVKRWFVGACLVLDIAAQGKTER
jgi:hypothetical protein